MQIASIELYDLLKSKLGEKEAKSLVAFVEHEVENKLEHKKDTLVTKEEFIREIGSVKVEIANTKADLIKWMFIFCVGQIGIQIGIIIALFKLFFN